MKNQWSIWAGALAILVVILAVLNLDIIPKNNQSKQKTWDDESALAPDMKITTEESPNADVLSEKVKGSMTKTPSFGAESALSVPESINVKGHLTRTIYTIQASSFKDQARAQTELKRAQGNGLPAYLATVDLGTKGVWFRIYVGEFTDKADADQLHQKVREFYKDSYILLIRK